MTLILGEFEVWRKGVALVSLGGADEMRVVSMGVGPPAVRIIEISQYRCR